MESTEIQEVVDLAKDLFQESQKQPKTSFLKRIPPLLKYPSAKFFLIKLLDISLRPESSQKANRHIIKLLNDYPANTKIFSFFETALVQVYRWIGSLVPVLSVPLIKSRIKSVTSSVILRIDQSRFETHVKHRRNQGIQQNINLIGEALLGEQEAKERITNYKKLIDNPKVDYISIKISTLYSQISSLAHEETVQALIPKLETIYDHVIKVKKKTGKNVFINLDMEEYRDLRITIDLFKKVLDKPRFKNLYAGIVLQAYIPDSFLYLKNLQEWAQNRIAKNGSPIKVRIVKGANMEMEKIESALKQWPLATHNDKVDTDAQYKKMLFRALNPSSSKAVNIGVASHNIFDIAFAIHLVEKHNLYTHVSFEMLEGLAESYLKPLSKRELSILLYTPVINKGSFLNSIAYLVRRFDESTAKGNFIREQIGLNIDSEEWKSLEKAFIKSIEKIPELNLKPKRHQNRFVQPEFEHKNSFSNSIDTDWTIPENQNWAQSIINKWQNPDKLFPSSIPIYDTISHRKKIKLETWNKQLPWVFELANREDIENAIKIGKSSKWPKIDINERVSLLRKAAGKLEENRAELIGVAMLEVGKLITEMDPEVSEAIDFANYYAESALNLEKELGKLEGKGLTLVLSPWNFPIAIPAGGILASLAAGNTVILKPATRAISCAYLLCQTLWSAGIPKDALQLVPSDSENFSDYLKHPSQFESVILTGGTETATTLLNQNPRLNLFAETGGKNATIITSFADRELAIKHVLDSAFNNTGQKCSATSLLILEDEVYHDKHFIKLLKDATESRKVGSPWNLDTQIGPLANPIDKKIENELHDNSNQWLTKGRKESNHFLGPSIILDGQPNDTNVQNELFGPILTIMRANNLREAINLVNTSQFGLTSGLESLDDQEIEYWKENIEAGNLYINRSTTGAVVKRQPFGGIKKSCFGPGMKAGGPNYLTQFIKLTSDIISLENVQSSYRNWNRNLFSLELDNVNIRGQHNITRYLRPKCVLFFIDENISQVHIDLVKLACKEINIPIRIISETESEIAIKNNADITSFLDIEINQNNRYRCINKHIIPNEVLIKMHEKAIHIYDGNPSPNGRIELLNYLQEQSISHNYHRYGNLMDVNITN